MQRLLLLCCLFVFKAKQAFGGAPIGGLAKEDKSEWDLCMLDYSKKHCFLALGCVRRGCDFTPYHKCAARAEEECQGKDRNKKKKEEKAFKVGLTRSTTATLGTTITTATITIATTTTTTAAVANGRSPDSGPTPSPAASDAAYCFVKHLLTHNACKWIEKARCTGGGGFAGVASFGAKGPGLCVPAGDSDDQGGGGCYNMGKAKCLNQWQWNFGFKKSSRRFFSPSLACLQNAVARYCLKETYWFDACVEHMTEGCLPVAEMRWQGARWRRGVGKWAAKRKRRKTQQPPKRKVLLKEGTEGGGKRRRFRPQFVANSPQPPEPPSSKTSSSFYSDLGGAETVLPGKAEDEIGAFSKLETVDGSNVSLSRFSPPPTVVLITEDDEEDLLDIYASSEEGVEEVVVGGTVSVGRKQRLGPGVVRNRGLLLQPKNTLEREECRVEHYRNLCKDLPDVDGCVKAGMARWCKNLRDKLEEKTNKLMEKPTGALRGGGPVSKVGNETNEVLGSKLPEIGQEQEQLDAERDEDSEVVDDGEVARGNNAIEDTPEPPQKEDSPEDDNKVEKRRRKRRKKSVFGRDIGGDSELKERRGQVAGCIANYLSKRCRVHLEHICPGGSCSSPGISHCLFRASAVCHSDPDSLDAGGRGAHDLKKPYDCVKGRLRKECLGNKDKLKPTTRCIRSQVRSCVTLQQGLSPEKATQAPTDSNTSPQQGGGGKLSEGESKKPQQPPEKKRPVKGSPIPYPGWGFCMVKYFAKECKITRPNVCPGFVCASAQVQRCLLGGPAHCAANPESPDHPPLKRKLVCLKHHLQSLCYSTVAPDSAQCYLRGITFCLNSKREKGEKPGQKETDATKSPAQKGVQKGAKKTQAEDDDVQKASPTFGVSKNLKPPNKPPVTKPKYVPQKFPGGGGGGGGKQTKQLKPPSSKQNLQPKTPKKYFSSSVSLPFGGGGGGGGGGFSAGGGRPIHKFNKPSSSFPSSFGNRPPRDLNNPPTAKPPPLIPPPSSSLLGPLVPPQYQYQRITTASTTAPYYGGYEYTTRPPFNYDSHRPNAEVAKCVIVFLLETCKILEPPSACPVGSRCHRQLNACSRSSLPICVRAPIGLDVHLTPELRCVYQGVMTSCDTRDHSGSCMTRVVPRCIKRKPPPPNGYLNSAFGGAGGDALYKRGFYQQQQQPFHQVQAAQRFIPSSPSAGHGGADGGLRELWKLVDSHSGGSPHYRPPTLPPPQPPRLGGGGKLGGLTSQAAKEPKRQQQQQHQDDNSNRSGECEANHFVAGCRVLENSICPGAFCTSAEIKRCLMGARAYCDAVGNSAPVVIDEAQNCMARRVREYCFTYSPPYLECAQALIHSCANRLPMPSYPLECRKKKNGGGGGGGGAENCQRFPWGVKGGGVKLQHVVTKLLNRRPRLRQLLVQHGVLLNLLKPGDVHKLLGVMLRETGTKGHVHLIKLIREVKQKQQQQQQQQQRPPPAIKKSPKQQQQQQLHPKTPRPRRRKRRRKRKKRRMPESVFRELHEHFFHGDPQDLFQIPVLQEYDAGGNKVKGIRPLLLPTGFGGGGGKRRLRNQKKNRRRRKNRLRPSSGAMGKSPHNYFIKDRKGKSNDTDTVVGKVLQEAKRMADIGGSLGKGTAKKA